MPNISGYGVRTAVAGTDRVFLANATSDQIDSATLAQIASLASGGGPAYTRPALSAFTESNHSTLCTATDISGGPIVVDYLPGGTYENLDNWNQSVSGSEWLLTACISQSMCAASAVIDYAAFGIAVKSTADQLLVLRPIGCKESLDLITWSSETAANDDLVAVTERVFSQVWYRIYYQASNTSNPYTVLRSEDGYAWTEVFTWNGTSGVSSGFTPASVCFFIDCGGNTLSHTGGTLWHWDIQNGTGASLNPQGIVSPL